MLHLLLGLVATSLDADGLHLLLDLVVTSIDDDDTLHVLLGLVVTSLDDADGLHLLLDLVLHVQQLFLYAGLGGTGWQSAEHFLCRFLR